MSELKPSNMEMKPGHNWYVIVCSWELEDEEEAISRFNNFYLYLNKLRDEEWVSDKRNSEDIRLNLDSESLLALNLIGRRKFLIICQSKSHKILLEMSKMIGLRSPVKVEVLPAIHVHDVYGALNPNEQTR
ncbi:MAG: hypothetical protein P8165_11060 [Deltaproteobacteria bacterium]|jgi:hypothetical protein